MVENKAITYSLLAHVRNSATLIKGPLDIFVPLIKRVLHKLNEKGITKGENISEIKLLADEMYAIDFPLPVIKSILIQIANEVNQNDANNFKLYGDKSFVIKDYLFLEFEEKIQESKKEILNIEKLFQEFCKINNVEHKEKTTIFDFIDKNKIALSKYLSNSTITNGHDFVIEAQFVKYFKKIPTVYEQIRNLYLGSILSSFLEYRTENANQDIELLLDTNFLVSLIDLNTPESTHTCNKLIEIGNKLGYKYTVLADTIEETKRLLYKKAEHFEITYLPKKINPEDIYNACDRRKLSKTDLERIADNLEESLHKLNVTFITDTTKLKNIARFSPEYIALKNVRNNDTAALHDAIAIQYVRDKRKKRIKDFEKVNCWFVNNSIAHEITDKTDEIIQPNSDGQPELIKADELLNILWLSNPNINIALSNIELIDIGITSLVAVTLNHALPKASIIKELDDNIQKYASDKLSDKDIILVSTRIVNRQLKNIQEINNLATKNKEEFVNKLKEEANKQEKEEEKRIGRLEELFNRLAKQYESLEKAKTGIEQKKLEIESSKEDAIKTIANLKQELEKEKNFNLIKENEIISSKRNQYIEQELKKWRGESWKWLAGSLTIFIIGLLLILYISSWDLNVAYENYQQLQKNIICISFIPLIGIIFTSVFIPILILKYHNHGNIDAYTKKISIPEELKDKK